MKKLLLVSALALSCLFANAQDGLKGTWFVGGQVGFGSDKSYTTSSGQALERKVNDFTVAPLVGTFVTPSVAVGAALGFESGKVKVGGEQTEKSTDFSIMPFARKYWNITGGLYFFGQAALPLSFGSTEYGSGDNKLKVNDTNIAVALAPGFDYIINDWISVETSFTILSARYNSSKPKGGDSSNSFRFNGNTHGTEIGDLTIGVKFLF
ncbi:outer membrane beta-barrel protein [uncultured Dysgonomonas sp.]|uniref:Outer membrane protein beta-barrel domain-containing protein n=1 Tax=uncultured Dysgonomonas sp. TaxID=206096 RepID=A0A212JI15_9BACT|nr:outer membrane beta-barrel protein [uncultured Dysgonomonas sp.]SBV98885.1 conserved exported hypothetical protein [uncultured Dysgonomonas sp.]